MCYSGRAFAFVTFVVIVIMSDLSRNTGAAMNQSNPNLSSPSIAPFKTTCYSCPLPAMWTNSKDYRCDACFENNVAVACRSDWIPVFATLPSPSITLSEDGTVISANLPNPDEWPDQPSVAENFMKDMTPMSNSPNRHKCANRLCNTDIWSGYTWCVEHEPGLRPTVREIMSNTTRVAEEDLKTKIKEIDSGMCEGCGKGAYLEEYMGHDYCASCTNIHKLMDDGSQDPADAEAINQPVPLEPMKELVRTETDNKQMLNAEDMKQKTKLMAKRHAEFVRWYGLHVNNEDMDKDELQAKQWLTERIMRSPTEEAEDWKLVMEMYEESRASFREKVRKDLEQINSGVHATMDIKKVYQSVCFNGFIYWTVVIPEDWFTQLKDGRKNKIGDNVIKYYDCRKIAIDPHKDEMVQMNPELSVSQDKMFLETFLQYENVLSKQMHYVNGPMTSQLSFYNGRLETPMFPTVVSKLGNVKKMGEDATLDNAMVKACLQFLPKVMVVEFVPEIEGMAKKVMEDRGYHIGAMSRLTNFCRKQGIPLGQSTARAPPQ